MSVRCSPPSVAGFAFDRHAAFGMQPCSEEAMDTVAVGRPPSISSSTQNTTAAAVSSELQSTTTAMDECDGNGVVPSSTDSDVVQSNLGPFSLPPPPPQPGVHFRPPMPYAAVPCHVISQQPYSDAAVHLGGTGGVPVPSEPVSVPCYAVRQLPASQPALVQPHVYYRPADGFCVTTTTTTAAQLAPLEQAHYGAERS